MCDADKKVEGVEQHEKVKISRYTGVPVSVLVPLPGPSLNDSLSVRLTIRTFDPSGLGIRTCTDTEAT